MIINSFFTKNGAPAVGLTPTLKIWEVQNSTRTVVVDDAPMVEDTAGYYWFDFSGYLAELDYVVLVDAGADMIPFGRYSTAAISPTPNVSIEPNVVDQIVSGVWDEPATDHTASGSFGSLLNQTKANTESTAVAITTIDGLLQTLLKFERNRTKIDINAKTLTVYDNDKVTPIRVFDLKDSTGASSITEVAERVPRT